MPSPFGFVAALLRRMAGAARADVEILPPEQRPAKPEWDLNMSVEERADVFASLFLNAEPKDMRASRMGDLREQ
jgi:hypothetical protein